MSRIKIFTDIKEGRAARRKARGVTLYIRMAREFFSGKIGFVLCSHDPRCRCGLCPFLHEDGYIKTP